MDTPTLEPIPQEAFVAAVHDLARQIGADPWRPDFLIGIGRGGLVPTTFLSHATALPMLSVDYSSEEPDFAAELLIKLAARTQRGTRLLFVDDINDSGRTIAFLRAALAEAGAVNRCVRFATLVTNATSRETVDYAARTIDRSIDKAWFVFPWEAVAPETTLVADALVVPERLGGD